MVLERYVDAIVIRSFAQSRVEEIASHAQVPVINALTDDFHPCQGLADFMTIYEYKCAMGGASSVGVASAADGAATTATTTVNNSFALHNLHDIKIAYIGDGNNMAHTYMEGAALAGMELRIATPPGYEVQPKYVDECAAVAAKTGAKLLYTNDPTEAILGADVVITDTWASMGAEAEHDERTRAFATYQIDAQAMLLAAPEAIFMHCLPAHRGEEVTDEVMDAPYSAIYDEAENRLHAQQALLQLVMEGCSGRSR
jgi:ornithine carbamoyltransferase